MGSPSVGPGLLSLFGGLCVVEHRKKGVKGMREKRRETQSSSGSPSSSLAWSPLAPP